ncbi:MAG: nitrous oxide reductase family maturation protein NosD [Promethearchaeota archaeon]
MSSYTWIHLILVFSFVFGSGFMTGEDLGRQTICTTRLSTAYEVHTPILIDGDYSFERMANMEGWSGAGTLSNPYLIEGYNITDSAGDLFAISFTTVHFIIRNCYFDGLSTAWGGIVLHNVINGVLENNTVRNINMLGIGVYISENITITDNEVKNTNLNGIRIVACPGPLIIANNIISNSIDAGIWVGDSSYRATIENNSIYENHFGILFEVYSIQYQGVFSSVISHNLIYANSLYGIRLSSSFNNSITDNVITGSYSFGVILLYPCENNEVKENNFINNNIVGTSQAKDNGGDNIFQFNFWNDHTVPDSNLDGIVDLPYAINGEADNLDLYPLTRATDTPPVQRQNRHVPTNMVYGVIFLIFTVGVLVILLRKNRN